MPYKDPEKQKEYWRKYSAGKKKKRKENPEWAEEQRKKARERYAKDPEKYRKKANKWVKDNQEKVREQGFKSAFVVAFHNNERISLQEAIKMLE